MKRWVIVCGIVGVIVAALSAQGFLRIYQDSALTNPCAPGKPVALSSAVLPSSQLVVTYVCDSGSGVVRLFINPDQIDRGLLVPVACVTGAPAPGWFCQDGGWLPPTSPLVRR